MLKNQEIQNQLEQHLFHLVWVSNLKVNNVFGTPYINLGGTNNNTVDLYNQRKKNILH